MRHRKVLFRLCCALLALSLMPIGAAALSKPSQAGERKLDGGQRDFAWPVPGYYHLSSCYLDNRNHRSLDIAAPKDVDIVASYKGQVIEIFTGCKHNYGKDGSCCSSWGNFVLLEHQYTLKNGVVITLYSRYAHLTKVLVKVGQTVAKGEKIGTNGSTGNSTGPHLDYDILMGGTSKSYSLDPYINELMELPEGVYTNFGKCCKDYVAYIKEFYALCPHENYDGTGACTACGYVYDWKATRDTKVKGYYQVSAQTQAYSLPYSQASGTPLSAGQQISANASLVNGLGQTWYEVALSTGNIGYVPKSAMTFLDYFDSDIKLSGLTVEDGMKLPQASYRLDGKLTSRYPLRKVVGYLDGEQYASWSSTGSTTQIELRNTNLNKKLSFARLAPGKHTLLIEVTDSTGRGAVQLYKGSFTIEKPLQNFTISFIGEETTTVTIQEGNPLGELPAPSMDGQLFLGWFTEKDEAVTAETIPTGDMNLYPKWEEIPLPTEPTAPTAPQEEPTQPTVAPETEPLTLKEEKPAEESPAMWWLIPVVLVILGGGVGVFFWIQKKKSAQALFR